METALLLAGSGQCRARQGVTSRSGGNFSMFSISTRVARLSSAAEVAVQDERSRESCTCPETGEQRAMAFQDFEAERGVCGARKCRCLAAAFDLDCRGCKACHWQGGVKPGEYGRILRIDLDSHDRRAHLNPHAVEQPVLAARVQLAFGDGADQQPPRPRLHARTVRPPHPAPARPKRVSADALYGPPNRGQHPNPGWSQLRRAW